MNAKTTTAVLAALAFVAIAAPASAQWGDPEGGDNWESPPPDQQQQQQQQPPADQQQQQQQQQPPPPQQGWQQQQQQQQQPPPPQQQQTQEQPPTWGETDPNAAGGDGATGDDHMDVAVGHLGVGFLGTASVPVGVPVGALTEPLLVAAPTIGVRYWLSEMIGLDVGLGFGFQQNSASVDSPGGVVSGNTSSAFAFTIHGGLPIAIFHAKHYKFNIIPELDLGFGSGTVFGATPNDDIELKGFAFEVGARAAMELHFGFIGVPELALQAGVGLSFLFSSRSSEHTFGDPLGSTVNSANTIDFGTRYNNDEPWDIFVGNLSALYYFR